MRLYELLIGLASLPALAAANTDPSWWSNDGDLCRVPEGNFKATCTNISMEFCSNLPLDQTPCKFNVACYTSPEHSAYKTTTMYLPRAVQFWNVTNVGGVLSHPVMDELQAQQQGSNFACNPCILPNGNYLDSCEKISIKHLPKEKLCLFRADCDLKMRKGLRTATKRDFIHNEALVPENTALTDVKNLYGSVIHPSNMLRNAQDFCYEVGETAPVAENSAWIKRISKVTKFAVGVGVLLTM